MQPIKLKKKDYLPGVSTHVSVTASHVVGMEHSSIGTQVISPLFSMVMLYPSLHSVEQE